jgi:outer membrane protein TolC
MKKNLLLSLFIIVCEFHLYAQDTLYLPDAIETSLKNNFDIQIAAKDVDMAKNSVYPGAAGMLPSVSISGGHSQSINDSRTELVEGFIIEGDAAASSNTSASVGFNYTIFDGFAMFYNYRLLKSQYELSELQAKSIIETAILNLINLYYSAAQYQQNLSIVDEAVKLSEERVKRFQSLSELGAASKLDLLNAQVDLNTDKASLQETQLNLENAKRNLNYAMGKNISDNFYLSKRIQLNETLILESLTSAIESSNTTVLMAKENQHYYDLSLKLNRSSRFPVLSISSDYGISESRDDAGFMKFSRNYGFSGGLSLSYPIFSGFTVNKNIQNAKINIEKSKLQYDQTVEQIKNNLLNAFATYQNKLNMLKLEKENLITAEQNFKKSKDMYDLGQLTSTQLREAQLNLIKAKGRISDAECLLKMAEAELMQLSGQLVK